MRLGLIILLISGLAGYAAFDSMSLALVTVCVVLVLLPPSLDPAILIKQALSDPEILTPDCYGTYPYRFPHMAAERDCECCPHLADCRDDTPFPEIDR